MKTPSHPKTLRSTLFAFLAIAATAALALAPADARAEKLFSATVTPVTSPPPVTRAENSNYAKMLEQIVSSTDQFAAFDSIDYTGVITYLGVPDTIFVEMAGTQATIKIPLIGFQETFDSHMDRDGTYNLVDDYMEKHGAKLYGKLLEKMAALSAVTITDGNPNAQTARMAGTAFFADGFTPAGEMLDILNDVTAERFSGLGIGFNGGSFEAGKFKGSYTDMGVPFRQKLGAKTDLTGTFNVNYLSIEGSKVYGFGIGGALPVRIKIMTKETRWNWRVTPALGLSARGSSDMSSGALIAMAGLTSTVDYRVIARKLIVSMVNQAGYYKSTTMSLPDEYDYDPRVNQVILKNGLRAVTPLGTRTVVDFFAIETNFLNDATVKNFTTLGTSIQWKATKKYHLTLGLNYDFGSDYRSWSVGLSSVWNF